MRSVILEFLDLFAGTGSLGIEALSRGARTVTFVESNSQSIRILQKNLEALAIEVGFKICAQDVFAFLKKTDSPFTLIFIDPPFTESLADQVMSSLSKSRCWNQQSTIAIESGGKEKISDRYDSLVRVSAREYGDKTLSIYKAENL